MTALKAKILGTTCLLIIILYIWQTFFRLPWIGVSPFEAVPHNTAMLVELDDWQASNNGIDSLISYQTFSNTFPIHQFLDDFSYLKTLIPTVQEAKHIVAALQVGGAQKLDWVLIVDNPIDTFDLSFFKDTIRDFRVNQYTYDSEPVYDFRVKKGIENKTNFSMTQYRNLLIFGNYSLLVEEAINQLKTPHKNITRQSVFQRIQRNEALEKVFNVYLNFEKLPDLITPFITATAKKEVEDLKEVATWLKLGLRFEENELKVKGSLIPKSNDRVLDVFTSSMMASNEAILNILPSNIAYGTWFGVDDFKHFFKKLEGRQSEIIEKYFFPWVGEDIAYVVTEPFSQRASAEEFVIFKMKEEAQAQALLDEMEKEEGALKVYDYQMFTIHQLAAEDWLTPLLESKDSTWKNPYYTIIEDYVVIGNDKSALEVWLDKYIVGETLSNNLNFLQFLDELPKEASLLTWFNLYHSSRLLQPYFKAKHRSNIRTGIKKLRHVGFQGLSMQRNWGDFSIEGKVVLGAISENKTTVVWKASLTDKAITKPVVFRNAATQQYEIGVQDANKNFFILNRGGDPILQHVLPDRILSDIYPMDFYKNGRLQYLFNTPNEIYLLNQTGENVGAFPIHLQSPATNGVAVTDFNRNKDYNFFVACKNRHIYGFDKSGRPLEGWNPRRGTGIVKTPLKHFQRDGKDYLVAHSTNRERILGFRRDGDYRFQSPTMPGIFLSDVAYQDGGQWARVVAVDDRGRVHVANTLGEAFKMYLTVGDNEKVKFAFCDVVGDNRRDYVVLSQKSLAVYGYTNNGFKKYLDYTFEHEQDEVFAVYMPGESKAFIGTLCKAKKQIYLLTDEAELYPDFPLAGTSPFVVRDLFNNRENIVIVANDDSIYAYRIRD